MAHLNGSDALTNVRTRVQAGGARWRNVYAGDHVTIDEVDVIARHPRPADWDRQKVRNDDSLVLELRWRDLSVVLTGDAGRTVEHGLAGRKADKATKVKRGKAPWAR